jgi:hypothetical protein
VHADDEEETKAMKTTKIYCITNLILSLAFVLMGSFAFANGVEEKKSTETKEVVVAVVDNKEEVKIEDEALRCRVTVSDGLNTVTMSCWFCNCTDLMADALAGLELM